MVELDRGGLLASCTLGCTGLLAPPRPRDSSRHCCRADLPCGLSSDPAALSDASLPGLSLLGKVLRAVTSKTRAHAVLAAPPPRLYHGSLVPTTATVPVMALLAPPALPGREVVCSCLCFQCGWGVSREIVTAAGGTGPGCERGLLLL